MRPQTMRRNFPGVQTGVKRRPPPGQRRGRHRGIIAWMPPRRRRHGGCRPSRQPHARCRRQVEWARTATPHEDGSGRGGRAPVTPVRPATSVAGGRPGAIAAAGGGSLVRRGSRVRSRLAALAWWCASHGRPTAGAVGAASGCAAFLLWEEQRPPAALAQRPPPLPALGGAGERPRRGAPPLDHRSYGVSRRGLGPPAPPSRPPPSYSPRLRANVAVAAVHHGTAGAAVPHGSAGGGRARHRRTSPVEGPR